MCSFSQAPIAPGGEEAVRGWAGGIGASLDFRWGGFGEYLGAERVEVLAEAPPAKVEARADAARPAAYGLFPSGGDGGLREGAHADDLGRATLADLLLGGREIGRAACR